MKLAGYQQRTYLCVKMEFMVGTISLSCELYSFSWSCFRSRGSDTIVYENDVSIYMWSAAEVAWLAPWV